MFRVWGSKLVLDSLFDFLDNVLSLGFIVLGWMSILCNVFIGKVLSLGLEPGLS